MLFLSRNELTLKMFKARVARSAFSHESLLVEEKGQTAWPVSLANKASSYRPTYLISDCKQHVISKVQIMPWKARDTRSSYVAIDIEEARTTLSRYMSSQRSEMIG